MAEQITDPLAHLRVLTMKEVSALTTYTPQHVYRLERQGKFPRRVRLGQNRIGYRLSDITTWMQSRPIAWTPPTNPDGQHQ